MKNDITNRQDIQTLVDNFYDKVKLDPLISPFFVEVAKIDWDHHLPILYDFWEATLLGTRIYKGNPMSAHINLNKLSPLQQQHFDRWLQLFTATVDAHFIGPMAEEAKARAKNIASLMLYKVRGEWIK